MTCSNDRIADPARREFVRLAGGLGLAASVGASQADAAPLGPAANTSGSPTDEGSHSRMRLPNIAHAQLTSAQRSLFDKLHAGIAEHLQGFTTQKLDGTLIGPFNVMLHFPALRRSGLGHLPGARRRIRTAQERPRIGDPVDGRPVRLDLRTLFA